MTEGPHAVRREGRRELDAQQAPAADLVDRGRSVMNRQRDTLNQAMEAGKQAYRDAITGAERNVGNEGV